MRKFFLFWVLPLAAFWGWFFGAKADLGFVLFSREVFDQTFAVYERMLGLNSDQIAWLILDAIILDSAIILAILAFRRRRKIIAFVRSFRTAAPEAAGARYARRLDSIADRSGKMGEAV
ncbi:DUF6105 family protein [Fulvimarina sp. 2208YS6-2-32]|uniref:DUF6105 family protein n=1 Tax=Fulvimarina uroteuthidis TaxID=3098149 RepID=A0ABU5I4X1_9HYPH|nr:DUF6105 family protein [Fulvimarina sp. 2208YS6-2-32]MDY8109778.1 DUF6105 family protein [Fulvimarina sp. 2208YS6-2-32]